MAVLERIEPERKLYLALSKPAFEELSVMETFELVVARFGIALLVVRIPEEEIEQWKI